MQSPSITHFNTITLQHTNKANMNDAKSSLLYSEKHTLVAFFCLFLPFIICLIFWWWLFNNEYWQLLCFSGISLFVNLYAFFSLFDIIPDSVTSSIENQIYWLPFVAILFYLAFYVFGCYLVIFVLWFRYLHRFKWLLTSYSYSYFLFFLIKFVKQSIDENM